MKFFNMFFLGESCSCGEKSSGAGEKRDVREAEAGEEGGEGQVQGKGQTFSIFVSVSKNGREIIKFCRKVCVKCQKMK